MGKKIIKRNGMNVYCYGDYSRDNNVLIVGTDLDYDSEIETTMEDNSNCYNWTQVVEEVTAWGKRNNCEIDELSMI
jgi:hypothetical protein